MERITGPLLTALLRPKKLSKEDHLKLESLRRTRFTWAKTITILKSVEAGQAAMALRG